MVDADKYRVDPVFAVTSVTALPFPAYLVRYDSADLGLHRGLGGHMDPGQIRLTIHCDERATEDLRPLLGDETKSQFIERRNLSGDAATWIVVATLAAQGLPHILEFLIKWRELGRVKRIRIDDVEIDNPSEHDLARLRARLDARHDGT
jgi:hypothetical protein